MPKIEKIFAREILDSYGIPTVSTTVFLDNDKYAFASVPSGITVSKSEAYELRDRDNKRYNGMGVLKAVNNVNTKIRDLLCGLSIEDPISLDKKMIELDSTENKENLGANAILCVSMALHKLSAISQNKKLYNFIKEYYGFSHKLFLPNPIIGVISGAKHSDFILDFQGFWIIPENFNNFNNKLRAGAEIFHNLGNVLFSNKKDSKMCSVGTYAPKFSTIDEVWVFIIEAIKRSAYNDKIKLGVDPGASNIFNQYNKKYSIKLDKKELSGTELINYYLDWIRKYKINFFEDPFDENDLNSWSNFKQILDKVSKDTKLIGDDLFSTNIERLKSGVKNNLANSIAIKPSQIGSVSETIDCIKFAQNNLYNIIIENRSAETNDDFIADLSVGVGAQYIKAGAPSRGERISKYNRLLEIEDELI